jgi:hypothetical protein
MSRSSVRCRHGAVCAHHRGRRAPEHRRGHSAKRRHAFGGIRQRDGKEAGLLGALLRTEHGDQPDQAEPGHPRPSQARILPAGPLQAAAPALHCPATIAPGTR